MLQLAIEATKVKSDIIVQCGVHFMAETSKILNPDKTVLIPDSRAGCSLASSITGADVRLLRERFPGVPVVAYVNTSADVKAEVDICCTSSNAVQVVESLNAPTVIFLPDQYLAKYVASKTGVKIIAWKGACEVHERFTGDELRSYREADPSVQIIAHPECPPDVLAEADFTGSTAHMIDWVRNKHPKRVVMITECSMADNVQAELPDVEMVRPCNLCPHMKRITLAEDSRQPARSARGSHDRSADRREGAAFGRADDQSEELSQHAVVPAKAGTTNRCRPTCHNQLHDLTRNTDDVVIVGGGLAGLFCALKLAPRPVTRDFRGAAGRRRLDGVGARRHRRRGRAKATARRRTRPIRSRPARAWSMRRSRSGLAREAAARIHDLLQYGVPFDRDLEGRLAVGREAAHSARRIVHVRGDMAGKAIIAGADRGGARHALDPA